MRGIVGKAEGKPRLAAPGGRLRFHLGGWSLGRCALIRGASPSTGLLPHLQVTQTLKSRPASPTRTQYKGKDSEAVSTKS